MYQEAFLDIFDKENDVKCPSIAHSHLLYGLLT